MSIDPANLQETFRTTCNDTLVTQAKRWVVAYSGGVDSHVLLHLLSHISQHIPVHALHVNHQLSANANAWQQHCEQTCLQLGIAFTAVSVELNTASGKGLEAEAREARYRVFETFLETGDLIFLGQHADDQVETFLLRLLRGAGMKGLSAMPSSRILGRAHLYRPFLDLAKEELLKYANHWQLQWVEDESNLNTQFDRNFLRQQLLPLLSERWPDYRQNVGRSVRLLQQSSQLQLQYCRGELFSVLKQSVGSGLSIKSLLEYDTAMQSELLRLWLRDQVCEAPSERVLQEILRLLGSRPDASPCIRWGGVELRRFQAQLYLLPLQVSMVSLQACRWVDKSLTCQLTDQRTLSAHCVTHAVQHQCLALWTLNEVWDIRFREGGEVVHPAGRQHSQKLKKVLQEYCIPPWERNRLPILYLNGQIAAVIGVFVCEQFLAAEGATGVEVKVTD